MPAIWENPFANAILKIERANKHIADIEQRLHASSDTYGPSLHINMNTGKKFLYYYLTDRKLRRYCLDCWRCSPQSQMRS